MECRTLNLEGREIHCYEDGSIEWSFQCGRGEIRAQHTKGNPDSWGYLRVHIGSHRYGVARIICEAFYGAPPSSLHQCDHINRNRADNRPCNLRWVTPSENCENRFVVENSIRVHRGIRRCDDEKTYRKIHNSLFEITVRLPNGKMTTRRCKPHMKKFLLAVNIAERLDIMARFDYYV